MGSGIEQGLNGYQDPRTGLWFASEAVAIACGYGKPVDTANTIVQVGSQGSYTQDGRLVGVAELAALDANNAGYVGAAAANLLNRSSSSADYARDWASSYVDFLGSSGVAVAPNVTADYPSSPQMVEVWKNVPALTPSAQVQYTTPGGSPGSEAEPPATNMISTGQTVGTQETTGIIDKAKAAASGYGFYVIGAIIAVVLLLIVVKGGLKGGVTS